MKLNYFSIQKYFITVRFVTCHYKMIDLVFSREFYV